MDENDATQVMPAADDAAEDDLTGMPESDGGTGGDGADATEAPATKSSVPRRWFAASVVAVLLLAVGLGIYLGMRTGDEPESKEVAQEEAESGEVTGTVIVPDLRGMTPERAKADAEAAGLVIGATATAVVEPSVAPAGTVLSQDPLPGEEVPPGAQVSLVIAEAPAEADQPPASGTSGTPPSGSGSTPAEPPPAPATPVPGDISKLTVKPKAIDLGLIQLTQWTTVVEHSDSALEWTSGPATFGAGDKRIIVNADGPNGNLVAVYSWDSATSTDWKLQSIIVSQPGDLPYQTIFSVPASTQTFMVRSNSTAVLWTLTVQEMK